MTKVLVQVGPEDHGKTMSLAEFDKAEGKEGFLYELEQGVIIVADVPKPRHLALVTGVRRQLNRYDLSNPGAICAIASGSECKLLLADIESERHPDLAIYKTAPPSENPWAVWIPELVIEVVSPGSEIRDYQVKREEYLAFGVSEYWIVDDEKQQILVLRRRGSRWHERVLSPTDRYQSKLLPGFELNCEEVFGRAV